MLTSTTADTDGTARTLAYGYDANGNLSSSGADTYVYDIENRLVSASGDHAATLAYDPLGRLWQVTSGTNTTRFLYDGDALVAEYDAAGAMTARYVHGGDAGADDPFVWYDGGTRRYLVADHQGSIVALTAAAGTPAINSYDEYGIPGVGNSGRFQYTGQAWLAELGMYYYKARIYSPTLGRFLQVDPVGYDGGMNLYGYVQNDPVNAVDPDGLSPHTDTQTDSCLSRVKGVNNCSGLAGVEFAQLQRTAPRIRSGSAARPPRTRARMVPLGPRAQRLVDPDSHLRAHIGRTPRQLFARLDRLENSRASTFRSQATMQRALVRAIRQNQDRIDDWIDTASPFSLEIHYTSPSPLGTVLYRGQVAPRQAYTATFILRPVQNTEWTESPYDYYVLTGYVE